MKRERYCRKTVRAGMTVDVQYTYPTRFGDELTRSKRKQSSDTTLAMETYNYESAVIKLTQILNENFKPDDLFITLHYEKDNRPDDLETARKQLSAYLAKLKKLYIQMGVELKWAKTTAFGERGAIHHHIVIPNGLSQAVLSRIWKETIKASIKARPPECRALYSTGDYSALAAYFCQQAEKSGVKEKNIRRWTCSRNMKKPQADEPKWVDEIKWKEPPVAWPGYYIETDSIKAGCNPVNGRPYLFYRMIKLPPDFVCYDNDGKRITGKTAVKYYRQNNKEYIKQNWFNLSPEGEVVFKTEKGERQDE